LELDKRKENLDKDISLGREFLTEIYKKNRSLQDALISLESQLEFLETLRTKYKSLSIESRAVIITETAPHKEISTIIAKPISNLNVNNKQKSTLRNLISNTFADFNFDEFQIISCSAKFITLEIKELKEKIEKIKIEIAEIVQTEEKKKQILKSVDSQIKEIEKLIQTKEIALANKNIERLNIEAEKKKLLEEATLVDLELKEIKEILAEQKKKEEESKRIILKLEEKDRQTQELISESQNLIVSNSQKRQETLVEIARLKEEMVSLDKETEGLNVRLKIYEENLSEQNSNLDARIRELDNSSTKLKELNEENVRLKLEIETQLKKKDDLDGKLSIIMEQQKKSLGLLNKMDAQIKNDSNYLDKLKEQIRALDIKKTELEYKQNAVLDRIREKYNFNLELQCELGGIEDLDILRDEIAHLRERLDAEGPVNLVAIEEMNELEKRLSFLTHQREDLLNAKHSLHQAINKINKTTKELFMDTFQKIQVEFRNFYRLLFGGGTGELILKNVDDVLESGIEIIARPPGKKSQNISLLSGGERALTAIALLFAIFKVKPSPFCILDEIDASLDEANIDRFSHVLQDFVKTSQFIIITHNKKTITMADVMYGITMEESGISKIVSVKFSDKK
jgi:chromosome segregation protein